MKTLTAALALLLVQADDARRDPWAGFGVGSWVVFSRKATAAGKTTERKEKRTIASIDAGTPKVDIQVEKDGAFPPSTSQTTHAQGVLAEKEMKAGASRKEDLKAGSRTLACTVTDYEHAEQGVTAKMTLWRCAEVKIPYRELAKDGADLALGPDVVKVEFSLERENRKESYRLQIVGLEEKLKVGDRELNCVLEELSGEEVKGGETRGGQIRRWLSDAVPGRVVRQESSLKGPKPQELVQQVLDFEVKQ